MAGGMLKIIETTAYETYTANDFATFSTFPTKGHNISEPSVNYVYDCVESITISALKFENRLLKDIALYRKMKSVETVVFTVL
jgi:hypothetical protein